MVTDVVLQTLDGGMTEIRMSEPILEATVGLRSFLFEAVYENEVATAEFTKAAGILGGLWEKVRERARQVPGRGDDRSRGPRRGREGLPRRHDRPLRGQPLRAAVHSEAVGVGAAWVGPAESQSAAEPRRAAEPRAAEPGAPSPRAATFKV